MNLSPSLPQLDEHEYEWPEIPAEGASIVDYAQQLIQCEWSFQNGASNAKSILADSSLEWDTLPGVLEALAVLEQDVMIAIQRTKRRGDLSDEERQTGIALSKLHRVLNEYLFTGGSVKENPDDRELHIRFDTLGEQLFGHWAEFEFSVRRKESGQQ